jgi:hypothetical protein
VRFGCGGSGAILAVKDMDSQQLEVWQKALVEVASSMHSAEWI